MKRRLILAVALSLALAACAARPGVIRVKGAVPALDLVGTRAIEGYDAVAYFEDGKPVRGRSTISHRWQGALWLFATAAHRDAFAAEPERYAPQYGNYCALAISRGVTAHGDPKVWAVEGGKLYLNNNLFAKEAWDSDRQGHIQAADQNWPLMPKSPRR